MINSEYYIKNLKMTKHPEGGYYSESYKSTINISGDQIGLDSDKLRPLSSSIYFMLEDNEVSHFHRLKSDEIWYYHGGEALVISVIDSSGDFIEYELGMDMEKGQSPQIIITAGSIFGSYIKKGSGYSLVGCMVSFGFDFEDFELFNREYLLKKYPQYKRIIQKLTQ